VWRNYYNLELKVRLGVANTMCFLKMLALLIFGADITFHMVNQVGTSETANAVYWRARKVLGDSTALTAASS
jgi:hypothetical protein